MGSCYLEGFGLVLILHSRDSVEFVVEGEIVLELNGSGSSNSANKSLVVDRPNSANVQSEQGVVCRLFSFSLIFLFVEEKRQFAEQLNELSLKQHHRQYSG